MVKDDRPPLRRIHTDEMLEEGAGRFSLRYWRQRETAEIVESLRPRRSEALRVKPDGRIVNGNIRIKVLEERGFDVNGLEREPA
ncbi:MAG TPA: hypothetical protein VNA19_17020 [Pyrinomonadaceae bacterium]|nr:hypothetical protein [Pyrinomonadaceae bacterium]